MPIIFLSTPVSRFVEKVIVDKYLDQGLDEITKGFVHNTRFKSLFNEMDKKNTENAEKAKNEHAADAVKQELPSA